MYLPSVDIKFVAQTIPKTHYFSDYKFHSEQEPTPHNKRETKYVFRYN